MTIEGEDLNHLALTGSMREVGPGSDHIEIEAEIEEMSTDRAEEIGAEAETGILHQRTITIQDTRDTVHDPGLPSGMVTRDRSAIDHPSKPHDQTMTDHV